MRAAWWRSARFLAAVCFGEPAVLWFLVALWTDSWFAAGMGFGMLAAGAYLIHLIPKEAEW